MTLYALCRIGAFTWVYNLTGPCLAGPPIRIPEHNLSERTESRIEPKFALELQAHKIIIRVSKPLPIAQKPVGSRSAILAKTVRYRSRP